MALTQYYVDPAIAANSGTGAIGDPFGDLQYALNTLTRDTTNGDQINIKAGTAEVLASSLTLATYGTPAEGAPLVLRGYTSTANDGGYGVIDCGGNTMWASTSYPHVVLIDLEIHTFGNNNGINISGSLTWTVARCKIHKGASSPSSKILCYVIGGTVIGCHVHDAGTNGTGVQAAVVLDNFVKDCPIGITNNTASGAVAGNFVVDATTSGIAAAADNITITNNAVCSQSAATGYGIGSGSSSHSRHVVTNNIIIGYSGAGGAGINFPGDVAVSGFNAFYSNTTDESYGDAVYLDLGNDVSLGADPFTSATTSDFSLTIAGKAALRGVGYPAAYLGAHANTDGHFTIGPVQYGEAEAAADYPAEGDVQDGVSYGSGTYTGTFAAPAVGDVQSGVQYGAAGTEYTGTFGVPAVGDVQESVQYGAGGTEFTGTLALPTEAQVESGVGFGASGTEFTGSLVGGSDWTSDEKAQIRQALGVTGTTAATESTGDISAGFAGLATDTEVATAAAAAILETPANKIATGAGGAITTVTNVTNGVTLADDAITSAKFDESTAFPLKAADSGSTYILRTGADGDTGETLSDQMDAVASLISVELSNTSDSTASGAITRTRGNTWAINATIGAITGYTSLWFTVKHSKDDADADAILQIRKNASETGDGLIYKNGSSDVTAGNGSITVSDDTTGAIITALVAADTDDMPVGEFYYDYQVLIGSTITTPDSGTFTIPADVTRSIA